MLRGMEEMEKAAPIGPSEGLTARGGPWVDLGLTLPVFIGYHLGVVFLSVKNASDVITGLILEAAAGSKGLYLLFTLAIGVVFAGVFTWLGRGRPSGRRSSSRWRSRA